MKKILLGLGALLYAFAGTSQVIVFVEPPSVNSGNYDFTYADPGSGWGSPDLLDPANAVTGVMEFATDGTSADSLACSPVTNDLTGKVAVLYRGTCQFGVKALNAENAGAIAVIVINNAPGAPIAMGAGTDGATVTIPVVMITDAAGALLKAEIEAGTSTVFIGSKSGFYDYDLGFYPQHILRPEVFGNVQALSQDDTEFDVQLGAWVINYGALDQTNVVLNCEVMLGASSLYTAASAPVATIVSGDSAFITLPTFSQGTYANGYYDIEYTITSDFVDEFADDNMLEADFLMSDSLYAYSRMDETLLTPMGVAYYRGASSVDNNTGCIMFSDPNASRVAMKGMTVSVVSTQNPTPTSLVGEFIEIYAYEWNDIYTDVTDAVVSDYSEISTSTYIYSADLQQGNVYVAFPEPLMLVDDQKYLFCMTHYGDNLYSGYDTEIDYTWNQENYLQPMFPGSSDGTWYINGFGTDIVPAMGVHLFSAQVGLVELPENKLTAYPNPASESVTILLGDCEGDVVLSVIDITGKIVSVQNVSMNSSMLNLDVTTLESGTYTLKITAADGTSKNVQIVVTR